MKRNTMRTRCPYCHVTQKVDISENASSTLVKAVTCDIDNNGCDKTFIIKAQMYIDIKTAKLDWDWKEKA